MKKIMHRRGTKNAEMIGHSLRARRAVPLPLFLALLCVSAVSLRAATDSRNPTSDEAVAGTWTGTAGSRYTLVDDYPDASGADYLEHGTTAGNITFGFAALTVPTGSSISSVAVLYYDQKSGPQNCNIGARLKVGGNYYNATTHNPANGAWTQRTDTWTTNPKSGAAWTVNDVNGVGANALQAFGWVSTDANPTIRLSSVLLQVTYTPPGGRRAQTIVVSLGPLRLGGGFSLSRERHRTAETQRSQRERGHID